MIITKACIWLFEQGLQTSFLRKQWECEYKTVIKGVLHLLPKKAQKLACFVLYLKIINTVLK